MNSAVHLTDEQIDDYLIGDLGDDLSAHLSGCPECQTRIAEMDHAIESFKSVSLAWSERQSATLPVRPAGIKQKATGNRRAAWAATAAAALVIGVAIPLAHHESAVDSKLIATHGVTAPAQTFSAERDEQIAQDNQMLQAIDREIGVSVSSPSETFGLETGNRAQRSAAAGAVRD